MDKALEQKLFEKRSKRLCSFLAERMWKPLVIKTLSPYNARANKAVREGSLEQAIETLKEAIGYLEELIVLE